MSIHVLAAGLLTSVQDLGRHGHAAIGVGAAGAMDGVALRLANALVGNDAAAAGIEMTLRGPRLRFDADSVIALAGADIDAQCRGEPVPAWRPLLIRAGSEIDFGGMRHGARTCLAVAGGIDVPRLLGSRSTDVNAGIGPTGGRALRAGDVLAIGSAAHARVATLGAMLARSATRHGTQRDVTAPAWSIDPAAWFDADAGAPIGLVRGAHFDRLDAASRHRLFEADFTVGKESNRVGYRLDGPALALVEALELVSESIVPGTLQLPPGGAPIVLMAEAPTTGGYPRIAHVIAVDLPRLAQRRPGDRVRFGEVSLAQAQSRYLERERILAALVQTINDRLNPQ